MLADINSKHQFTCLPGANFELIALLSHQIRSPLYTIRNAVTEMKEECDHCTDECKNFLAIIDRSTDRLVTLAERCLRLMEIEERRKAQVDLHCESPVNLYDLVFKTVDSLSEEPSLTTTLNLKRIRIEAGTTLPKPSLVRGDAFLIEQALSNLIANALQYGRSSAGADSPAASVSLEYLPSQQLFRIEVTDFGAGISEEHQNLVLSHFTGSGPRLL